VLYPDLASALSPLVAGRHAYQMALLLQQVEVPLFLSIIHVLQIQNGFRRGIAGRGKVLPADAENGRRLWAHHIHESIYEVKAFDVAKAYMLASLWTDRSVVHWSDLLHIAVARGAAIPLISFEPEIRAFAEEQGVEVFPAAL
jgi:hypothetical protein